jgi:hypothetical protein
MAKKRTRARTRDVSMFKTLGAGTNIMIDTAMAGFFARLRDESDILMERVEHHAMDFRARFMKSLFASVLLGLGALFLFGAFLAFLVSNLNMGWAGALLLVGIIIMAVAYVIQLQSRRK